MPSEINQIGKTDHQEAQKSKDSLLDYWGAEVQRAIKRDSPWIERGVRVVETYRGIYDDNSEVFNILWANTEVLKPAIYNTAPVPEVERRFLEKDPIGGTMATVMERTLEFCMQIPGRTFNSVAKKVRDDMLLPGRGVLKVVYAAEFEEEKIKDAIMSPEGEIIEEEITEEKKASEECWAEYVYWKDFGHSWAKQWDQVWWVGFAKDMTREQLVDEFGEAIGNAIPLAGSCYDNEHYYDEEGNFDYSKVYKASEQHARIWEIWDKDTRQVLIISEGYDKIIDKYDDPYGLDEFFPTPEPLYSVTTTGTLVPVPEYTMYQYQAEELNTITRRITRLTEGLKARGIGDAEIKSLSRLFDGDDNSVIMDENYAALVQAGGISGAISWVPIETIAQVLSILRGSRRDCLDLIYELTGISDIMRGSSEQYETATAVNKKSRYGSVRVHERQKSLSIYFRNVLQIMSGVMAELFDPETFIIMSGVENRPDIMQGMEEVMAALKDNAMRDYTISVQTGSTIAETDVERKDELSEFFSAITGMMKELIPAVQQGIMPMEVAKELMLYAARRFEVGRELEAALEQIGSQPPQQEGQEEEGDGGEQEAMLKVAEMQMQVEQAKLELKKQEMEMDFQIDQLKLQIEAAKLQVEMKSDDADRQVKIIIANIDKETVEINARGGQSAAN